MNHMQRHNARKAVSLLSSFLLSIGVLAFLLSMEWSTGFGNKNLFQNVLTESGYFAKMEEELVDKLAKNLEKYQLPEQIGKDIVEDEQTYVLASNYVRDIMQGKAESFDTKHIQDVFETAIRSYLIEQQVNMTQEVEQGIREASSSLTAIYNNHVKLYYAEYLYKLQTQAKTYLYILWVIAFVCIVVPIVFVLRMYWKNYVHRGIRYMNYGILAALCMNAVVLLYLRRELSIMQIGITPLYYKHFLGDFFGVIMKQSVIWPAVTVLVFALLLGLTNYLKKKGN